MEMVFLLVVVVMLVVLVREGAAASEGAINATLATDERRLQSYLRERHQLLTGSSPKSVLPSWKTTEALDVRCSFYFQSVDDVNPESGTLTLNLYRRMSWIDAFSGWNPADFGNITSTVIDPDTIWTPGLYWYAQAGPSIATYVKKTMIFAYTFGNETAGARMYWTAPQRAELQCAEKLKPGVSDTLDVDDAYLQDTQVYGWNLARYPFDVHACSIAMGGWDDGGHRMNLSWMEPDNPYASSVAIDPNPADGGEWVEDPMPVWDVAKVVTSRIEKTYSCCTEPWPILMLFVYLRRNNGDIVLSIYLPIFMSVVIGMFAYVLPLNSGERFSVGASMLLSVFAIIYISRESEPTVGAVSLQSVFYFSSIWWSLLPIAATSILYKLTNQSQRNEVTAWERSLIKLFRELEKEEMQNGSGGRNGLESPLPSRAQARPSWISRIRGTGSSKVVPEKRRSIRTVWMLGRRKAIEIERSITMSSTSTDSDATSVSSGTLPRHPFSAEDPSPPGGLHAQLTTSPLPSFAAAFSRNAFCILSGHEKRISRFITVTFSASSIAGYGFFLLLFYFDTSEAYGSPLVRWLAHDVARYYAFIIVSSLLWWIVFAALFLLWYTMRQIAIMHEYYIIGLELGVSSRIVATMIVECFISFDVRLDGLVPRADLEAAFYRISQKDEVVNFAFQTLMMMDSNNDDVVTMREFAISILEAVNVESKQRDEMLRSQSKDMFRSLSASRRMETSRVYKSRTSDVADWSVADVSEWLFSQGLYQHLETFTLHGIDGPILLCLTDDELRRDLKIKLVSSRRRLKDAIDALREGGGGACSSGRRDTDDDDDDDARSTVSASAGGSSLLRRASSLIRS